MSESKIVKGTFSLTLSTIIVKVLGLIYKIPLASLLGDEGMGYFNSAYTVYAFFYLICTAGVPKAVMILTSEEKARGEYKKAATIVRIASRTFLVFGIVVCAVFIILAKPLSNLIGNTKASYTMVAIAPSIIFVALAGVIRGYLSAESRLLEIAVSQVLEGVGKLVSGLCFAIIAIKLNMPLNMVSAFTILGVTLGAFIGLLYLIVSSKSKITKYKAGQKVVKRRIITRIFSISIPITLSAAAMSITNIIDLIFIMRGLQKAGISESTANTLYGNYTTLAVPMFNLAMALLTPISIAFIPHFTEAFVKKDNDKLHERTKNALSFTALLSAPITLGMFVYSKEILSLLFGNSGINVGAPLLCILSPAIVFSSALLIINSLLESVGNVKAPIWSMMVGSVVKVIVSYTLITSTETGIMGAPIGTVLCYGISLIISLVIFVSKFKKVPPILSTYIPPYINAFASVLISKIAYNRIIEVTNNFVSLIFAIIIAGVLYILFSIFVGLIDFRKKNKMSKYTKFAY